MRTRFYPVLLLAWLLVGGCEKNNPEPQLPPETQEGKNTFGCKVNGKVWLPKSRNAISIGRLPSLHLSYDPDFKWGSFNLSAVRYVSENDDQTIMIGSDSIPAKGVYTIDLKKNRHIALFLDRGSSCWYDDESTIVNGTLIIKKLDLQNLIIAGTFEFTASKSGCKIIEVSEGRFDMKL